MTVNYVGFDKDPKELAYDHIGLWRIFNGQDWTHGFRRKEDAKAMAEKWGGVAIGLAALGSQGEVVYRKVEEIKKDNDKQPIERKYQWTHL